MTDEGRRSQLDRTAEIGAYRFGALRRLTALARWQVRNVAAPRSLAPDLGWPSVERTEIAQIWPVFFLPGMLFKF
jgi:hypothetical protein